MSLQCCKPLLFGPSVFMWGESTKVHLLKQLLVSHCCTCCTIDFIYYTAMVTVYFSDYNLTYKSYHAYKYNHYLIRPNQLFETTSISTSYSRKMHQY